jgi:hypothetical protein
MTEKLKQELYQIYVDAWNPNKPIEQPKSRNDQLLTLSQKREISRMVLNDLLGCIKELLKKKDSL